MPVAAKGCEIAVPDGHISARFSERAEQDHYLLKTTPEFSAFLGRTCRGHMIAKAHAEIRYGYSVDDLRCLVLSITQASRGDFAKIRCRRNRFRPTFATPRAAPHHP